MKTIGKMISHAYPRKSDFSFSFTLFLQNSQCCAGTLTQNTKGGGKKKAPHQQGLPLLFNLAGYINEFY